MGEINKAITRLEIVAGEKQHVIYDIHFCRAGIGIKWHDRSRYKQQLLEVEIMPGQTITQEVNWRDGIYMGNYYPDLEVCIAEEYDRLKAMSTERVG